MRTTNGFFLAASLLMLSLCFITTSAVSVAKTAARKQRPLSRAELKQAEARLAEMGYQPGRVDGVISDDTRKALIIFQ
jgi:hypothetical protein